MSLCLIVARKELREHVRDTRAVASAVVFALMGPAVVMLVSFSRGNDGAAVLLSMASVFALVSAFAGGMNLALDTMAGERERRSLVPLLLNPASRLDLVLGKWIATGTLGIAALMLNLLAFTVVLARSVPPATPAFGRQLAIWMCFGLVPLALLGAAIHLHVAANSRSTKEAHSWLSLVTFVPMIVGLFLVFFPGWSGRWWFLVPIAGQQSLIARTLQAEPVHVVQALVLAAVTLCAAVPALLATERALGRPDVIAS